MLPSGIHCEHLEINVGRSSNDGLCLALTNAQKGTSLELNIVFL